MSKLGRKKDLASSNVLTPLSDNNLAIVLSTANAACNEETSSKFDN